MFVLDVFDEKTPRTARGSKDDSYLYNTESIQNTVHAFIHAPHTTYVSVAKKKIFMTKLSDNLNGFLNVTHLCNSKF